MSRRVRAGMTWLSLRCGCIALVFLLPLWRPALAAETEVSEYEAKAAFLYNFTKFVEWPEAAFFDAGAPLVICVYGDDPFGPLLDRIVERRAQGRSLAISRVTRAAGLKPCHMLFVAATEQRRLSELLLVLRQRPVLLVGDSPGFAEQGVAINLVFDGQRVRLEINPESAQRRGLRISSRILRLARIVQEGA